MAVKSDRWIIHQCTKPTHQIYDRMGMPQGLISPPYSKEEQELINNWCDENQRDIYGNKPYAVPLPEDALPDWKPMIEGFFDRPVRYVEKTNGLPIDLHDGVDPTGVLRKVISYGTSSYGYDVRLAADPTHIKVFTNVHEPEIDPKRMKETNFGTPAIHVDEDGARFVWIPAHSYIQGPTVEYFRIPRDILVIVLGKSTYARSALICNVTPIEPEFEGHVVIEVANVTSSPVRCYLDEGIAQFVFFQGDEECLRSYKDKGGKYMYQTGLTLARV
jgi:dCTP deaminase